MSVLLRCPLRNDCIALRDTDKNVDWATSITVMLLGIKLIKHLQR